jgi:hypothetical protein
MLIHSYFTEGYFSWGKLFIESLKKSNGEENQLIISTRNLDQKRIDALYNLYKNLEVRNDNFNYNQMSKRAKIGQGKLMNFKNETENIKVNVNNKVWKLMVAGDDRIKEVKKIIGEFDGELVLHFDIDSYIIRPLDPWIKIVEENDFTSIFRIKRQVQKFGHVKRHNHAICICFQGYNVNEKCRKFMDKWIANIDAVNPPERPKGFGQTTIYHAYLDMKDELKWGDIPKDQFSLTGYLKNKNAILIGANKGSKTDNLRAFRQDFKKRFK